MQLADGRLGSNYAYTLGLAGNRLTVAELSGRSVAYGYDSLYRLTSENVTADPNNHNGTTSYLYDPVGNRQQLLVNGVTANSYTYDADDRLGSDQYDADGNTINSLGTANAYDFENHMTQHGLVTVVYDGDGNRVSETVGGVTTNYLVDAQNPTGYAQVVDELQGSTVTRTYGYGLERIDENQLLSSTWAPSFYGYDGHGSVRQLTNSTGTVTDSYDYDAFGNIVNQTGSTPNNYLFAGEQYDPALNLYYNRARYLNTATGRFWSMDTEEGEDEEPWSLHKYIFADGDPVDNTDHSGNEIDEVMGGLGMMDTINAMPTLNFSAATTLPVTFALLWSNYPPVHDPCPGVENQCAIRLAITLKNSFVKFNSYPGGKRPPCGIQAAEELANWLDGGPRFREQGGTEKFPGAQWKQKVGGRTGIIFFQHYWQRSTDKGSATTGNHIDLWNRNTLTPGWASFFRFTLGVSHFPNLFSPGNWYSDLSKSKAVWFWEVK